MKTVKLPDVNTVEQFAQYVAGASPHWILHPERVEVTQPENQAALIERKRAELGGMDARWGASYDFNLSELAGGMQWLVNAEGYSPATDPVPGLTEPSSVFISRLCIPDWEEIIPAIDFPNLIVNALIETTAAKIIRDDFAEGNQTGRRVYKGMLLGKSVYFKEVMGESTEVDSGVTHLSRVVCALGEGMAKTSLAELSVGEWSLFDRLKVTPVRKMPVMRPTRKILPRILGLL